MKTRRPAKPATTIRYANCWEDPLVMLQAIRPEKGGAYLSVASAGDNALSLLTANPNLVVAVDSNPAQLACLDFRRAAFATLAHREILEALGLVNGTDRLKLYDRLRGELSETARRFWDARPRVIRKGIIHAGTVERHFHFFRQWLRPILLRKTPAGRVALKFRARPWRVFLETIAHPAMLVRLDLGRSRPVLAQRRLDFATVIRDRIQSAASSKERESNPYLEYILGGNFRQNRPHYLEEENYPKIRRNLDRLAIFHGRVLDALNHYSSVRFDGFNLSDIFETMDQAAFEENLRAAVQSARAGARVFFLENLVEHQWAGALAGTIVKQERQVRTLMARNRAFFYGSIFVGKVVR